MRQLIFILAASFCLAAACNKEHLPEYYFKCKVNGQEYVPDNCANCRTAKVLGDTLLILGANRYVETIAIYGLEYPLKEKIYDLLSKRNIGSGSAYYDNTIGNPVDIYRTQDTLPGQLSIATLDKTNKIIAGTFYFDAFNVIQNKTVRVT